MTKCKLKFIQRNITMFTYLAKHATIVGLNCGHMADVDRERVLMFFCTVTTNRFITCCCSDVRKSSRVSPFSLISFFSLPDLFHVLTAWLQLRVNIYFFTFAPQLWSQTRATGYAGKKLVESWWNKKLKARKWKIFQFCAVVKESCNKAHMLGKPRRIIKKTLKYINILPHMNHLKIIVTS